MPERPILAYEKLPAEVRPYDPRAVEVAERVARMVHERLPGVAVEHIGSTAIPGCGGKGYVDLMIPFSSEAQLHAIKDVLEALGFQRQASRDPFPESRPMRTGALEHEGTKFQLHVHVIPDDTGDVELHRVFRDRMRADPDLVAAYVVRKREIVESGVTDGIDYSIIKGEFVQDTLRSAQGE